MFPLWLKFILWLLKFRFFSVRFGSFFLWVVTNRPEYKEKTTTDTVYENNNAEKGQIRKAKLVCKGTLGDRTVCRWEFEYE